MCFLISFQQQLSGAAERTDCVQQEKLPDKKSFEQEEEKRCRVTVTKSLKLQSPLPLPAPLWTGSSSSPIGSSPENMCVAAAFAENNC